ncbi:rho guanine nucleotide exchange factor 15 [Eucyclogobius newberryi]|uniref:rho guanine nucleotide exchange factor 15 n=1 Tax=Eucyclogobius newberryi TaxID=166745 RepID=UPI003B59F729
MSSVDPFPRLPSPHAEVPPKPLHPESPLLGDRGSPVRSSGGMVQSMVTIFSKQEPAPSAASTKNTTSTKNTNGNAEPIYRRISKARPPTIKPKPGHLSLPLVAPPLPMKRSKILKKQESVAGNEGDGAQVESDRSEPDGKEVEAQVFRGRDADSEPSLSTPLSPCCEPCCTCVCHQQHPGMMLIWVPLDPGKEEEHDLAESEVEEPDMDENGAEDTEQGEDRQEEETDTEDELDVLPNEPKDKTRFQQNLNVLIAEGHRRRSDPGPHAILRTLAKENRAESPPIPPKRTRSPSVIPTNPVNEEESIYEVNLPLVDPTAKKCKELDIPLITVRKLHGSKLSYSTSDPSSEFQTDFEDAPPAIPPRMPIPPDTQSLTRLLIGFQPIEEEVHSFLLPPRGTSPQRVSTPPKSPLAPHRPPPPPPKSDPRRLSTASVQSLPVPLRKEELNEKDEDESENTVAIPRPVRTLSLRKGASLDRLQEFKQKEEPLYQTYRASVITKEIKRQTVCRNISKVSADFNNGSSPVPTSAKSTLWQDLQAVRDCGALEELSPEQCKYQESMFEVLTSEVSYLRSLGVLIEHFMANRELEETLIIRDKKELFSNILRIREVSERFLSDLEDRIFEKIVFSDICDIIHYHAQHNFPAYIDYVRNQFFQEKTYTRLLKNNVQFTAVITRLQESPQCQRLPFMSFLLLPFQRITRLKMLIENILKRTKEKAKEEETASKALASVAKIMDECNTEVGKMKQTEELILISMTLEFEKLKAVPIISPTRSLEKKGELQEMSKGGTLFHMRAKFNPVYLFLFNDLLLITTKKSTERFVVVDYAHRSLVQVQGLDDASNSSGVYENCFNLILLENHQKRLMERLLKAASRSDMERWMAAFPSPTKQEEDDSEVIYEDWDCPQVQCVEQYVAQQADEISLEPTEIINVVKKGSEGMYQGIRLSDGQKGWFPAENVIEITNEHVRRRNLRERYRVMQAASNFTQLHGKSRTVN